MFRKVLVANRGEIAVRIMRGLRESGIASVAVYSEADRASLHVRLADEAVSIGASESRQSYLNMERIIQAAGATGAEAIHPGYGFLSENADFAELCHKQGLVFIGPPASAIRAMGLKTEARRVAQQAGVPVVPGAENPVTDLREAKMIAAAMGYPVMLKAAAGGGGKGMRQVRAEVDLEAALRDASSEAERSFSNGAVYLERCIEKPRHIEIQVLLDQHGNGVHLGERECSIQRRHQKVIEECPSPFTASRPELREQMGQAALRAARAAGYHNAGTVEFLVDETGSFYFLEMNTRLQVEHPVTELVTGRDLVQWQLRVAAGERLGFTQRDVVWNGAAIECRICAEDPDRQFLPSPGRIEAIQAPTGPGVRLDTGVYAGWMVPVEYDPLLAKLVVWAETRKEAIDRLRVALREFSIRGIKTNLSFFRQVVYDSEFQAGNLHTGFIEEFFARSAAGRSAAGKPPDSRRDAVAAIAAVLHWRKHNRVPAPSGAQPVSNAQPASRWLSEGRSQGLR
ncbi:MAG: acetyl-CoA carboxylase biotin carboxylase subunit [Acidobacteriia bacterium]|nr:acetyl-CoA carboxylase biotin carboxylase subunit [Terriglobia bacterium]